MLTGKERRRECRIKTNPLCELVLVAMATIITSHLVEQEQGERMGGKNGTVVGMKTQRQGRGDSWEKKI